MKNILSLVILSITLYSCGGGVDCDCDEIVKNDGKYYRSGAFKEGDRVSFGELFSGVCETNYASGEVRLHQEYSNGIKHGTHFEYYENTQLKEEIEYKEGKKLIKKTYYISGQLESDIQYEDEYVQSIIEGVMEQKKGDYKLYYGKWMLFLTVCKYSKLS
jgi:antitoxin component YwqK of YwqJK toxin-antitoxin module